MRALGCRSRLLRCGRLLLFLVLSPPGWRNFLLVSQCILIRLVNSLLRSFGDESLFVYCFRRCRSWRWRWRWSCVLAESWDCARQEGYRYQCNNKSFFKMFHDFVPSVLCLAEIMRQTWLPQSKMVLETSIRCSIPKKFLFL
jgi:hypothetical protein